MGTRTMSWETLEEKRTTDNPLLFHGALCEVMRGLSWGDFTWRRLGRHAGAVLAGISCPLAL